MLKSSTFLNVGAFARAFGGSIRFNSTEKHFGFRYHLRHDQKDPPIVPSKLFKVQLRHNLRHVPWWDKKHMAQLGLNPKVERSAVIVVKNTPEMCTALWKVKHLVRIIPITFPNGEPTEEDIGATFLNSDGTMCVSDKYKVDPVAVKATKDFKDNEWRLRWTTKKRDSHRKWNYGYDLD